MKPINSQDIIYKKPPLNSYLGLYNDKLAEMLVDNFSLKYLSSATINRLEAQTKFYEYLEKYVQICNLLDEDSEINIHISEDDQILHGILKNKYGNRISGYGRHYFLKLKIMFFLRFFISIISKFYHIIISRLKPISGKKYDYVIRTYFDYRSIDQNGLLKDQYFGNFINDLKINGKLLVVYKVMRNKDYFKFIRMKSAGFDSVSLDYFLNPFSLAKSYIAFFKSHIVANKRFIYNNRDCTDLFQLFLDEDYLKLRGIGVFIEKEISIKLLRLEPENIFFPYENQTWEKIYQYIKKSLCSSVKIIGYQHTGVSYKLLNYFPSKLENKLPVFPDKVITVGVIINNLLLERANYPSEIVVGGALRFNKHFVKDGDIEIKSPTTKIHKKIVYAFSYDRNKYGKIINLLKEVFGESEITVLLKFHPDYVEEDILKSFKSILPDNFIASGAVSWDHIFQNVDFVLYDDNSIAFEGMIHGLKTFSVADSEQIYDITRKFDFDIWQENLTKDDLIRIRNQLLSGMFDKEFDIDAVHKYLSNYFTKYSSKEHFDVFTY